MLPKRKSISFVELFNEGAQGSDDEAVSDGYAEVGWFSMIQCSETVHLSLEPAVFRLDLNRLSLRARDTFVFFNKSRDWVKIFAL